LLCPHLHTHAHTHTLNYYYYFYSHTFKKLSKTHTNQVHKHTKTVNTDVKFDSKPTSVSIKSSNKNTRIHTHTTTHTHTHTHTLTNKPKSSHDQSWYQDDKIRILLRHYLITEQKNNNNNSNINKKNNNNKKNSITHNNNSNINKNVVIFEGIHALQYREGNMLAERITSLLRDIRDGNTTKMTLNTTTTCIIPIIINQGKMHWTGLYIYLAETTATSTLRKKKKVQNKNCKARRDIVIGYFDPFRRGEVWKQVIHAISNIFPDVKERDILTWPTHLAQFADHDCGAWIIAILIALVRSNGKKMPLLHYDINAQRLRDAKIVEQMCKQNT